MAVTRMSLFCCLECHGPVRKPEYTCTYTLESNLALNRIKSRGKIVKFLLNRLKSHYLANTWHCV
jgi:hypothetical protein